MKAFLIVLDDEKEGTAIMEYPLEKLTAWDNTKKLMPKMKTFKGQIVFVTPKTKPKYQFAISGKAKDFRWHTLSRVEGRETKRQYLKREKKQILQVLKR